LIIGHGRSGTNLLLDLVDAHPSTNCRNEPNFVAGGAIAELFGLVNVSSRYTFDSGRWRAACARALRSKSLRDRPSYAWKAYARSGPVAKLGVEVLRRHRLRRRIAERILPAYANEEFLLPGSVVRHADLDQARLVLKLGQANQLGEHLDQLGEPYKLVHIARNPLDVVRSWSLRWLVKHDPKEVWRQLYDRAARYFEQAPHPMAGELRDDLDVHELELMHVVLGDDHLFRTMRAQPHYLFVSYEYAAQNRLESARLIYDFLDLDLTEATERRIGALKNDLFAPLPSTQSFVHTALMKRLIEQSALRQGLAGRPYFRGGRDGLKHVAPQVVVSDLDNP
jgi:hypothetical protein